jgi:hypothetical protein
VGYVDTRATDSLLLNFTSRWGLRLP